MRPSRSRLIAAYAGMCAIWSSTWLAIKVGLAGAPPFTSIAVRMTIATAIVFAAVRAARIPIPREARFVRLGVLLGFFHIVLPYSLVYFGEQRIQSGLAAVLYATMPLFVALLARVVLKNPLTIHRILGIIAGMAGVGVIFSSSLHLGSDQAVGTLLVLGSVLAATVGSIATKRWSGGYHPVASLLIPFTVGAVTTWVLGACFEHVDPRSFDARTWLTIVYLAAAGSVGAFSLFFFVMRHLDVTFVSYQTFIIPVLAVLLGWAALGEHVSIRVALGGGMILAGVTLATILEPRRAPATRAPMP